MTDNKVDDHSGVPRSRRWLKRVFIAAALIAVALFFLIPSYHGFRPRALISEAGLEAGPLRDSVASFYEKQRRLPGDAEAKAFVIEASKLNRAQSVAWDSAGRMIVITVRDPHPGKRFAFHAEERDGILTWACRTIDLETKFLPGNCR